MARPTGANTSPASAAEYGKGVGAMSFETLGVATSPAAVRRQGGFATPGAVEWKKVPGQQANAGTVYGGTVGALALETRGLATNASAVRRQGGAITASAVQWVSAPAE